MATNKVFMIGNLVRDVELTETPNGTAVAKFSIAVSRDYANADGTREDVESIAYDLRVEPEMARAVLYNYGMFQIKKGRICST